MAVNDRTEILKPYLSPDGSDRKSFLEINVVSQLSPFGEQSSELPRDEFLTPEVLEMPEQFSPLKS